ncbi:MAG: NAD-dependent malic enzyme [Clostridiales bacterium]|nr:NAD-dependent malic enzyme [Clostridiales bacterium]
MDYYKEALRVHEEHKGKLEVVSKVPVNTREDLSVAYTPGVAQPCREIKENPDDVYRYTSKGNMVAVITDGSAVLGLGNIGAKAALPVMEGKCVLFKEFAGVDAYPICIDTQDTDEIVFIAKNIAAGFGGINLEDISAPRCFEVEKKLQDALEIPVFHDDQHGTAVVASAALLNALKVVGKNIEDVRIVVNGAGAAGTAITKMFLAVGAKHVLCCDKAGILSPDLTDVFTGAQIELAALTNPDCVKGSLADAVKGADVFLGVSAPRLLTQDMVRSMAKDPVIFAMANPEPEIMPELAKEAGAAVVGTGRSDYPNQINNVMIFPGLFKGALRVRAKRITEEMKVAAAHALAGIVTPEELSADCILPLPLRKDVADIIADAVAGAWRE